MARTRIAFLAFVSAVLVLGSTLHAEIILVETFENLDQWTVVDADGAGTAAVIEAVGGKLHVTNDLDTTPTQHGLHRGQVLPAANARVYFWGLIANGSRPVENVNNGGAGPVGTFNLSNATGVQNGFGGNTPLGNYMRNRLDSPGTETVRTEAMRIVNNDNHDPFFVLTEGVSFDLMIDYTGTTVTHWFKLSSAATWDNIGGSMGVTLSGSAMFLNISAWGGNSSVVGEGANWTLEQIDVTDHGTPILTAPLPEPGSVGLLMLGGLCLGRRRRVAA